ncbi:hypothetical protein ACNR90_000011, partial (mitochondrion) [Candidozyma auris]
LSLDIIAETSGVTITMGFFYKYTFAPFTIADGVYVIMLAEDIFPIGGKSPKFELGLGIENM